MGRIATHILLFIVTTTALGAEVLIPRMPLLSDMISSEDVPVLRTVNDVRNFIKDLRVKANAVMANSFSEHTRKYRSVQHSQSFVVSESKAFKFAASDDIRHYLKESSSYAIIESANITYMVLSTTRNGHQVIAEITHTGQKPSVLSSFHLSPGTQEVLDKVTGSLYGNALWLAFGSTSSNLVNIVTLDIVSGRVFLAPNIPLQGFVSALYMFQHGGKLYLVTGTTQHGISSSSGAVLYMLLGNYFDVMDSMPLKADEVSDITGFADGTSYYLVLALKSMEGTKVYRFSSDMETLKLIQELPDKETFEVTYFYNQHDNRKWILTLSIGSSPKLYVWERERFFLWQSLSSKTVLPEDSVSMLNVDSEVMIFLSQNGNIGVFLTDHTGQYQFTFNVNTNCSSVYSLETAKSVDTTIVSYICINENGASEGYKANILKLKPLVGKSEDYSLQKCLGTLANKIEERKQNVETAEGLLPFIMTADGPQEWSTSVDFPHGLHVSGTTEFKDKLILQDHDNVHKELLLLSSALEDAEVLVKDIPENNRNILFYNGDQTITGFMSVPSVTVDFANLGIVQFKEMKGVNILDFPKKFLMNDVYQSIGNDLNITELTVQNFIAQGGTSNLKINNIFMEDFMIKTRKDQVVSGKHTFGVVSSENLISSKDFYSAPLINYVKTTDILLRDQDVSFNLPMNLKLLEVKRALDVDLVNKVSLRRLADRAVYSDIDEKHTLPGSYLFDYIHVTGNVDVKSINGHNLQLLDMNVLKKTGDFTLRGILEYENDLVVGDASSVNFINGISVTDLVDLKSEGTVLGDYHIKTAVVSEELLCDSINGVDFGRDVVITDKDQVISGHIGFASDVLVYGDSGVLMADGTCINHYDISELDRKLKDQVQTILIKDSSNFTNHLTVLHDVKASSINDIPLEGIEERFWRRSVPQIIEVPVQLDDVVFSDSVLADSINRNAISDYLNIDKPQTLFGHFDFKGHVTVNGNLDVTEGHTIGGVDISNTAKNTLTRTGNHHVMGYTIIQKLKVDGDLEVKFLDKWRFPDDLMFLDRPQTINNWTLLGHSKASSLTAGSKLSVKTLSGLNVKVATDEIAYKDEDAVINSPLLFIKDLYVNEVFVNGKIDGIDLKEVLSKALKRSSGTQYITGPVVVSETLDFLGKAEFSQVNDKDWNSHLLNVVQRNFSGKIDGVKTFLQPMEVKKIFAPDRINNISVIDLYDVILSKSRDQTVTGYYTFAGNVNADTVQGNAINGIDLGNLLLVDKLADTQMNVTFKSNVEFAGGLSTSTNILNGCNITELNVTSYPTSPNRISFYSPMNNNRLHITGNVTMYSGISLGTKQFDPESFIHSLVSKSSDEDILGKVTFSDEVIVDEFFVESSYGFGVSRLLNNTVRDDEDITIDCQVDFQYPVDTERLTVSDSVKGLDSKGFLVNGMNLSRVLSNSVRPINGTYLVQGNVNFTKGFRTSNLSVTGNIGNIRISDLVNMLQTDRFADVHFLSPIYIKENLQVHGLIDGHNLDREMNNRIALSSSDTVLGDFTFDKLIIKGDLEVSNINDIQIADLVVKSGRSSQEITGQKTFNHLNVNGNIEAPIVDGIDFEEFQNRIIRKDQDKTFTLPVTFMKEVRAAHVIGSPGEKQLENVAHHMKSVSESFVDHRERIHNLYSSIYAENKKNYLYAQSMFCELAFIEKLNYQNPDRIGELEFVNAFGNYLIIRSCFSLLCPGESVTSSHEIYDSGNIEIIPTEETSGSRFVLTDPSADIFVTIDVT
ncbi:uncharacterized protein LOC135213793 [Macrobrachium nipponense]|uniref:uncharacterized protein LOC135213793 n=1 Tax=Macrobrachium nipponense TaxID=159736 RepID=UPI0030C8AB73